MKKKSGIAIALSMGALAIGITSFAASSFGSESSSAAGVEEFSDAALWASDAVALASSKDVADIEVVRGMRFGAPLGTGKLIEPRPGYRLAIQETSQGALCGQGTRLGKPMFLWCQTEFGPDGAWYAYNTGNAPGKQSSLAGLVQPDVDSVRVRTTISDHEIEILHGAFWWEGEPDERIVELRVTRNGDEFVETRPFAPAEIEVPVDPVIIDE